MDSWLGRLLLAARSANRRRLERRHAHKGLTYADWVQQHDTLNAAVLRALQLRLAQLPSQPLISVLMPVFNPDPTWLQEAIACVERQIYPHWELCIADDCSTDGAVRRTLEAAADRDQRIRVCWRSENGHISRASNNALEIARGAFVALLDHDDVIPPHALLLNAEAIAHHPRARLLYSDEDMLRFDGERQSPNFKPDWNPELLRSQNLICHLGVYDTGLVREIGGFRPGLEGAQDYDLALRCVEQLQDDQILHIPHVLYHWRQHAGSSAAGDEVKPYIAEAGRRALQQHLDRTGLRAEVSACAGGGYRVLPALPSPPPTVSIVVAAPEGKAVDAGFASGECEGAVRIVDVLASRDAALFDTAQRARGDFLCLLHSSTPLPSMGALQEMVALATVPGTGAVGAKLVHPDGRLACGGYVLGAGPGVAPAHPGLGAGEHGYRSRAVLNQNVAAVSAACLVIRRAHFIELRGCDVQYSSSLRDVDLCLRLRELGLRTVWAAHAEVVVHDAATPGSWPQADLQRLRTRWAAHLEADPAYNPNLDLEAADFRLAPQPRVSLVEPWFTRPQPAPTPAPTPASASIANAQPRDRTGDRGAEVGAALTGQGR